MTRTRIAALAALSLPLMPAVAQVPAFPGASGPGRSATGGRGGDVYHVTTLDADKNGAVPGSLQYGINNAPAAGRTIVFDVGGTIYLDGLTANDRLRYGKGNLTIAGQTAPGPGITIAGTGTKWTGENLILRNLTIRPNRNSNGATHDAFDLQVKNSILDHVTATWFTDEGISQTDSGVNSTVQYANISEGLNYAGHSYGSIIATEVDGTHVSFNHNLYAHNNSRMPRLGSETGATGAVLDWSNNVVYNWQSRAGYSGTDQQSRSNFIGNYYIKGQNNGTTAFLGGDDATSVGHTQVYQSTDPSLANKFDDDKDGRLHDGVVFGPTTTLPNSSGQKAYSGNTTFVSTPFTVDGAGAYYDTADQALDRVIAYGGANWNRRHEIDQRIVDSVSTGAGRLITDLTTGVQAAEWAAVMAERTAVTRPAGFDVDGDGMPGEWEVLHGLDPAVANPNGDFDADGYTDLEEYLNELGEWPAPRPLAFNGATNNRYAQITNWDLQWQPSKYDTAVIAGGVTTVDAPGQHAGRIDVGSPSGATLEVSAGWLRVEDAAYGDGDGAIAIAQSAGQSGELRLTGGKLVAESLRRGAGGVFTFTGGELSVAQVGFDLTNSGGVIAPGLSIGDSLGQTDVVGDATLAAGALAIDLASPTENDRLTVTGRLALGGDLVVSLLDGFDPASGDWVIATAGSFTGAFASITPGYAVEQQGADLVLSLQTTLPGDYDGDGDIDPADYAAWANAFGQQGPNLPADGNADGRVDAADYTVWRDAYTAATSAAVPEPTALLLTVLATTTLPLSRRRKPAE